MSESSIHSEIASEPFAEADDARTGAWASGGEVHTREGPRQPQ